MCKDRLERVYFVTAFLSVDYSDNPATIEALVRCGNYFKTEAEAISALKKIQNIITNGK